jgi:hypothetical protein
MGSKKHKKRSSNGGGGGSTAEAITKTIKYHNPLLQQQDDFLKSLTIEDRTHFLSPAMDTERRSEIWMSQADVGEILVNKYAWATPDDRAIRILQHFSPLVEIGCGANAYWCNLLQQNGVDILGYDVNPEQGGRLVQHNEEEPQDESESVSNKKKKGKQSNAATKTKTPSWLRQGGPQVLSTAEIANSKRTLFLCYPDEDEQENDDNDNGEDDADDDGNDDDDDAEQSSSSSSMGLECLQHYTGEYVIHVGELVLDANLSMDQAPWGRSSAPGFQICLASQFHCLLKASIPNWLHVRDTISVWKRSSTIPIVFDDEDEKEVANDEDDDDDDNDDNEDDEDDDEAEEVEYKYIPVDEQLPITVAAPCLEHLLKPRLDTTSTSSSATTNDASSSSNEKPKKTKTAQQQVVPSPKVPTTPTQSESNETPTRKKKFRVRETQEKSSSPKTAVVSAATSVAAVPKVAATAKSSPSPKSSPKVATKSSDDTPTTDEIKQFLQKQQQQQPSSGNKKKRKNKFKTGDEQEPSSKKNKR